MKDNFFAANKKESVLTFLKFCLKWSQRLIGDLLNKFKQFLSAFEEKDSEIASIDFQQSTNQTIGMVNSNVYKECFSFQHFMMNRILYTRIA